MKESKIRAHLREALRWSGDETITVAEALAAGLGMAAPVALGFILGRPSAGFAAALGALAVGRVLPGATLSAHVRRETQALAPAVAAAVFVVAVGALGSWRPLALLAAAAVAATIGGYSRPMVVASMRFVIYLTIVGAAAPADARAGVVLLALILLGALWTSALGFAFAGWVRGGAAPATPAPPLKQATARQRFERWRRTLAGLAGWSYPLRLTVGLALGAVAESLWPEHHLHWIGLTVALLTPRQTELAPVKTTQRAFGTVFGVAGAGLALRFGTPPLALAAAIGLLAGLRPLLRAKNYLAYSVVMTPLVALIVDGGRPPEAGLLADRLLATVAGAVLVTAASAVFRAVERLAAAGG